VDAGAWKCIGLGCRRENLILSRLRNGKREKGERRKRREERGSQVRPGEYSGGELKGLRYLPVSEKESIKKRNLSLKSCISPKRSG